MAKLSAAQRSKIRRLAVPPEPSPDDAGGELNIVPFLDIIMNILIFVLATVAVTFTTSIETTPPSSGGKGPRILTQAKTLNLSLILTNDGISIKTAAGNIAPGCNDLGAGVTIPSKGSDSSGMPVYDFAALKTCAKQIKSQAPDFKSETNITISASNHIDFAHVVETADAVRVSAEGEELFPDVRFGVIH